MNKRQARQLLALYTVDVFLDAHALELPETTSSGARRVFTLALAELHLHLTNQAAAPIQSRGLTRKKADLVEGLKRDHLRPIAAIARSRRRTHHELVAIRMPKGDPALQKVLGHASGMAKSIAPFEQVFIDAGCRPNFMNDLAKALDEIMTTVTARTSAQGRHSGATAGLQHTLSVCWEQVRILDSLVRSEIHHDQPLVAAWESAKHVDRFPRRGSTMDEASGDSAPQIPSSQSGLLPSANPATAAAKEQPILDPSRLLPLPRSPRRMRRRRIS